MKQWMVLGFTLAMAACHPADVNVRSLKERLESGEIIEYTQPGSQRETCPKDRPVWSNIDLPKETREGLVLGKFVSVLGAGKYVCYQVGNEVRLTQGRSHRLVAGRAVVQRIALIKADNLQPKHLKGKAWAAEDTFNKEKALLIQRRLKPRDQGVIYILDLAYIGGSAADEKSLFEKEREREKSDGFQQTENEGDKLSKCDRPWFNLNIAPDFKTDVLNGRLGTWFLLGERNCFAQGQEANLKLGAGSQAPLLTKVKVVKVKRVKLAFLTAAHIQIAPTFDFKRLHEQIHKDNETRNAEYVSLIDFTIPSSPPSSTCQNEISTTHAPSSQSGDWEVFVQGKICANVGDIVQVWILKGSTSLPATARIKALNIDLTSASEVTRLELEYLGGQK